MADHWEVVNSGRVVVSNTVEELWQNACSYFLWCRDNPIKVQDSIRVGKDAGTEYTMKKIRAFSVKGLCLHCGIEEEYLMSIRNQKDKASLWYQVVSKILYIIHTQNLENATVGIFNPIFVSRVLNMEDSEVETSAVKIEIVQGLPALSTSENEILEKLEQENQNSENDKEQFS